VDPSSKIKLIKVLR